MDEKDGDGVMRKWVKEWLKRPLRCKLFLHESDGDYGMDGLGGAVISDCKHCGKRLRHLDLSWFGGGGL